MPVESCHIDAAARTQAASLLEKVKNAEISRSEWMNRYPKSTKDRAVLQIYVHLLSRLVHPFVKRFGSGHLKLPAPPEPEEVSLLERTGLFLRTDLAYRWPRKPVLPGLMIGLGLILGLVIIGVGIAGGTRSWANSRLMGFVQWASGGVFLGCLGFTGSYKLSTRLAARPSRRWREFGNERHWPFASDAELAAAQARPADIATEETPP